MVLSKEELNAIVRWVVTYYLERKKASGAGRKNLIIIPRDSIGTGRYIEECELSGKLKHSHILADSPLEKAEDMCPVSCKGNAREVDTLLEQMDMFDSLELYCPSINLIKSVVSGDEGDLFSKITIYFLLNGKRVLFYLPYDFSKLPDGGFSLTLKRLLSDATDMGATLTGLYSGHCDPAVEDMRVVTEDMVQRMFENGTRSIEASKGTIVTPLAADKAKELGVAINKI